MLMMTEQTGDASPLRRPRRGAGWHLAFLVAEDEYGIPIGAIDGIVSAPVVRLFAGAPAHVHGMTMVHGVLVPVIDLRARLRVEAPAPEGDRVLIVVDGACRHVGLLADRVRAVVDVRPEHLEAPPIFGARAASPLVVGLARSEHGVRLLLDVARLIAGDDVTSDLTV
jgi:purine-binding chemotaxis protein CheW